MARMLQALKNLEARSPAKPAPKSKATLPQPAVGPLVEPPATPVERVVEPLIAPPAAGSVPPVTESIDALAKDLASLDVAIQDPPVRFDWSGFSASVPPLYPTGQDGPRWSNR